MRILVVSQYYYPEPFRINEVCEELARRGHDVIVLTGIPNYPEGTVYPGYENIESDEVVNGVKVLRCKIRPRKTGAVNLLLNYLSFCFKAGIMIKKLPDTFDVVYSYQLSPITSCLPASWYSRRFGKPHLLYCLDLWPESVIGSFTSKSLFYKITTWLSKKVYASADIISVTSPSFIDYLAHLLSWPQNRFFYNPQHGKDFHVVGKSTDGSTLCIVFTGNVGKTQNLDVLIDAFRIIKDDVGIKAIIVGTGSELNRLKSKVSINGLSDRIVFVGRQPKEQMPKYYAMADFCFLSLADEGAVSNTIPGKLQEYMSAGKPVLAAINGDARFIIDDAQCGVCVDYNDSVRLASIILDYAHDKKGIDSLGLNSRDYYLKHFTLNSHVDNLEKCMQELVN